jgi:glyoxylase-like metal-dependent hydrolase (beta-lactamase superfamily II)
LSHKPIEHRRREPAPGVFRLNLPLPFEGLDRVNAYLLAGDDGLTFVDCGIYMPTDDRDHGWDDVREAFAACDARVENVTRLVVTHPHIDHYGMAGRVIEVTDCDLMMHPSSRFELEHLRDPEAAIEKLRAMLIAHVTDEQEVDELTAFEDWRPFVHSVVDPTTAVEEGDSFEAGGRGWEVVHTPGHSPGHVCLFARASGLLISGDHLLPSITPHIDFRRWEDEDPLGDYLESLGKVEALKPALVLPGHGRPFDDGAERARAIARHHDRRLGAILQVIRSHPHTAAEITDEIFGSTLLNFQKRLALGEALAHLAYLRHRGEVERIEEDDAYRYVKARRR